MSMTPPVGGVDSLRPSTVMLGRRGALASVEHIGAASKSCVLIGRRLLGRPSERAWLSTAAPCNF